MWHASYSFISFLSDSSFSFLCIVFHCNPILTVTRKFKYRVVGAWHVCRGSFTRLECYWRAQTSRCLAAVGWWKPRLPRIGITDALFGIMCTSRKSELHLCHAESDSPLACAKNKSTLAHVRSQRLLLLTWELNIIVSVALCSLVPSIRVPLCMCANNWSHWILVLIRWESGIPGVHDVKQS